MTDRALLLVPRPAHLSLRAGGMTVIERQLWTLRRAGIKTVWVGAGQPKTPRPLRLPQDLEVRWTESGAGAELACEAPYLAVSADHFIRVETLRYVAQARYPVAVSLEDEQGVAVVQAVPDRGSRAVELARQPLPKGSTIRLEPPLSRGPLTRWLLAVGIKPADGFMAKNFDRYVSLAVSRLLLDTTVSPNMMTVASSLLGLVGAACFLIPRHEWRLLGALLVLAHSVSDGCDGELARIRFQESNLGADIDFWGDNVVHLALFFCIAWGFYRADQDVWPLIAAVAASVGTLGSAVMNYRERLAKRRDPAVAAALEAQAHASGVVPTLTKIENMLAARDFIYLLVLLAYFDRLYEFMWAAAVGSLLFFFMMLYLGGKQSEQIGQPDPPREGQAGSAAPGNGSGHQHLYSRS